MEIFPLFRRQHMPGSERDPPGTLWALSDTFESHTRAHRVADQRKANRQLGKRKVRHGFDAINPSIKSIQAGIAPRPANSRKSNLKPGRKAKINRKGLFTYMNISSIRSYDVPLEGFAIE